MTQPQDAAAGERRRQDLARIKSLLGVGSPGDRIHPYAAQPVLTEDELAQWESASGVSLPEEYRLFLLEIGNGGRMAGGYCDFEVWPLGSRPTNPQLRESFPISAARLGERMAQFRGDEQTFLKELDDCGRDGGAPPGCLEVARYPSYDSVALVVTGELRGTIWCAAGGWRPEYNRSKERLNFLTWFEDSLLDLCGNQ